MAEETKRTKNRNLQNQLSRWVELCDEIVRVDAVDKRNKMIEFCRCFVPSDITEEDCLAYAENLLTDEELFDATRRELNQCATGNGVESIKGNQKSRAIFTLLPLQDTGDLDIVREISFISSNKGVTWTAEG